MKGKELIFKVLQGEKVERTPWVPYTGAQIANLKGYTAEEMFRDGNKLLECCLEAESQYSPDGMTPMFDLQVEAEILGCELTWYKNTPPTVSTHPLMDEFVIPTKKITKDEGRIPLICDTMRKFKQAKPEIAMYGLICGPFTLASHLRGTNIFMDMYDDEDKVKELINYCTDVVLDVAQYYIEAGCDIIAPVDPLVSQISPDMFETFLEAPYTKIFETLKAQHVYSSFFVCGDVTRNIEPMCKTKPDAIGIDENVDIVEAKKITDAYQVTISGNLQLTITMLMGTQQDNQKAAIELMDKMGTQRFILAPGCDIPFDVPVANVIGIGQAVQNKEMVKKALENYVKTDELPEITLPDYKKLDYVLVECATIDAQTCAACTYTVSAAKKAAEKFGDKVKVVERSIMTKENLAFVVKVGLKNLPAICIDGEIRHISLIPPVEELEKEYEEALKNK